MITIFSAAKFKTIPWKNGLGHTTELAISDGGNLDDFDWRLSIASVVNDGDFSNFAGYQRNLILIEGNGLILDHRNGDVDKLTKLLDISHFDGASKTHGALVNGGIKDFNIMTKQGSFAAQIDTYPAKKQVSLSPNSGTLVFAYSLSGDMTIEHDKNTTNVTEGALVQLENQADNQSAITITGENMIIIQLTELQ
ncbi:HutD/Ves family protein [Colwellia piezophila]|uniref:HutD/Ves family protein n=1 Tax=Colwellia piezophila TaxID=211668 RepID=UPI000372F788|nr:HutD family protein [Colwellia piezophila]